MMTFPDRPSPAEIFPDAGDSRRRAPEIAATPDPVSRARGGGFALFDTAIGRCGIAWGEEGIVAAQLPEATDAATRARLLRRRADLALPEAAPPPEVAGVIDSIQRQLQGERLPPPQARLDWSGISDFNRRVYDVTRAIPAGTTLTYGEVAARIGEPGAAQAVGRALGANPFAPVVPCHRVLARGGKANGFSAHGGIATKARMLAIEGAPIGGEPGLFGDLPVAVKPR